MYVYVCVDVAVRRKARDQHQGSYVKILHHSFWDRAAHSSLNLIFMLDRLTILSWRFSHLHGQELRLKMVKVHLSKFYMGTGDPDSGPHVCKALHSHSEPFPPSIPFVEWKKIV